MFDEERQIRGRNNRRHSSISNNIPIFVRYKYIPVCFFFLFFFNNLSMTFNRVLENRSSTIIWKRYKIPLRERGKKKKSRERDKNGIIQLDSTISRFIDDAPLPSPSPYSFSRFRHRDHVPSMSIKNVNRWLNEGGEEDKRRAR